MNESDEKLFERSLQGDDRSLRTLMERHGDALMLYLNGYVRDLVAAEDLMIESFSRMYVKRPSLRAGGFKPYLYKVGRNLALHRMRERSRVFSLDDLELDPEAGELVEEVLLATEQSRALYSCLDRIPGEYREALFLVYIEEMSYDEAGAVMRKTRKQIDNLVQRGKRAARELLEAEGVRLGIG